MNNSSCLTGLRYAIFSGILTVCAVMSPTTYAENSLSADGSADTAIKIVEIAQAPGNEQVVSLSGEDALIVQNGISRNKPIISAAYSLPDVTSGQHKITGELSQVASRHTESNFTAVTADHESRQMPHSLVLALITLILLIPVSRRTH